MRKILILLGFLTFYLDAQKQVLLLYNDGESLDDQVTDFVCDHFEVQQTYSSNHLYGLNVINRFNYIVLSPGKVKEFKSIDLLDEYCESLRSYLKSSESEESGIFRLIKSSGCLCFSGGMRLEGLFTSQPVISRQAWNNRVAPS